MSAESRMIPWSARARRPDVRRFWVFLVAAVVLAGCAGTPTGRAPADQGRGGGYYLDDGPGTHTAAELAALAALPDPVPTLEPLHTWANRPFRVMGNDYRPMTQREPFVQRGLASWYGKKFHGRATSTGETYDMYRLTAAHPTLPIPSFARVTNLDNGRSVVVRVNDRGPFLHNRAIDLSYLAAYKLGYVRDGSAPVEVELIDPARPTAAIPPAPPNPAAAAVPAGTAVPTIPAAAVPSTPPVPPAPPVSSASAASPAAVPRDHLQSSRVAHYLQLGAFSARSNAEAASARLAGQLEWLQVPIRVEPANGFYRVQAGPYPAKEQAARAGAEVESRIGLRPLLLQPSTE